METKDANVLFSKGGSGGYSSRITIPVSWLRELKIDLDNKKVALEFDGEKIIIKKK